MDDFKLSSELLKEIIEGVNVGIALVDSQGCVVYANPESRELLGDEEGEYSNIISCHPQDLHKTVKEKLDEEWAVQNRVPKKSWHRTVYNNGRWVDNYLTVIQVNNFKGVVILSKDTTEEVELRQALEKANFDLFHKYNNTRTMAYTDGLTGVYNISYLDKIILGEVELDTNHVGVMMIDINELSRINEISGKDVGDMYIKETAKILINSILGKDIAIRYSEDDFLILLPDCKDTGVKRIHERIESNVDKWNKKNKEAEFKLELAIGCTSGKIYKLNDVIETAIDLMHSDKRKKQK